MQSPSRLPTPTHPLYFLIYQSREEDKKKLVNNLKENFLKKKTTNSAD